MSDIRDRFDFPKPIQIGEAGYFGQVDNPENVPIMHIPKQLRDALFNWRGKVKLDLGEEETGSHLRDGW